MRDSEGRFPPRKPKEAIKLANLWSHLPQSARQEVLSTATRILKAHLSPPTKEATYDRS